MKESKKRVLVGMSGGIDSTATCLMLQEQGYEIVGVTMRVWGDEPQDARELAARMGIEQKREIKKIAKSICLLQKESVYLKYKKTQIWQTPNYREYPKLNKLCCMPN